MEAKAIPVARIFLIPNSSENMNFPAIFMRRMLTTPKIGKATVDFRRERERMRNEF